MKQKVLKKTKKNSGKKTIPLIFKDCLVLDSKNQELIKSYLGESHPFLNSKGGILEERIKKDKPDNYSLEYVLSLNANKECQEFMGEPILLGIKYDFDKKTRQKQIIASYYIGVTWLIPGELSAIVEPRIDNLDLDQMYAAALSVSSTKEADYFSECYGIDFESEPVEVSSNKASLTPLLILHFLSLLNKLVKTGLKKGYVTIDENLKSKIKGKLLISPHLRKNILAKRADRNFCRYQEYSADIPENRLLKKALLFARRYAQQNKSLGIKASSDINKLLCTFENVSDEISISQVQKIAKNKLFKLYPETCKIAKMILQNYDYSISNIKDESVSHKVQPYWIDMARLFELYVYGKLNKAYPGEIVFQAEGFGKKGFESKADYVKKRNRDNEGIVIDAKYKPRYNNSDNIALDDVREVCGYARDEKILEAMGYKIKEEKTIPVVSCLVIFPNNKEVNETEKVEGEETVSCDVSKDEIGISALSKELKKAKGFYKFYKIAIDLPIKANK